MVVNPKCKIWQYFDNIVEEGVAVCKLCKKRLKNAGGSVVLRKHMNKLHNPNLQLWKYYDNIVEAVAVCKLCSKRVKTGRQFILIQHLKLHGINPADENKPKSASISGNDEFAVADESRDIVYIIMEEKILVGGVMGLMIDDEVAPQIFASKNMKALLNPICYAISKQEEKKFNVDELQCVNVVHSVASYIRNEFSNDLHWRLLSLKIDKNLNSLSNTYYISVQFINGTQVETRTLGKIILEDKQQLTEKCIKSILHKFNIDSQQIISAFWDNSKARFNNSVLNSDYLREIKQFEENIDIYVGDTKLERYIGVIAQLCVLDVLKNSRIFQLLIECRNLVQFINDNLDLFHTSFKKHNIKIPQLDSPWRWGSTYIMINDLREAYCVLENVNYEQPECLANRFNLNDSLKNFMVAFCKAINIVHKSVQKFYGSEMIYGDFYAQWLKCKLVTEKLYNENSKEEENILTIISSELLKSIEKRSDELLNQDYFKACLYLDPRFQHTLTASEEMFALEYLKQLWNRAKLYNAALFDPVSETEKKHQQSQTLDDDDAFLNEFLSNNAQGESSSGIYKKLVDLKLPFKMVDVLSFWENLKVSESEIYALSTICFAIPVTQNYDKIFCKHDRPTSKMPSDLKEELDLIRLNQHLLDKAIEHIEPFREDYSPSNELSEDTSACQQSSASSIDIPVFPLSPPSTSGRSIRLC